MKLLLIVIISLFFGTYLSALERSDLNSQNSDQPALNLEDQNASYYYRGYGPRWGGRPFVRGGYGPGAVEEVAPPIIEEVRVDVVRPVRQDKIRVIRPVERKQIIPGVERTVVGAPIQGDAQGGPPPQGGPGGPGGPAGGGQPMMPNNGGGAAQPPAN